jgi:F-type H+-transporting ATPase subunit epsilon
LHFIMPLTVEFVTPTNAIVTEEVDVVSAPTPLGEISVLPNHVPFITTLASGELRLRRGDAVESFVVSGGVLAVRAGSRVAVLADVAERAEDISEAAAEEARRRALELRSRVAADDVAFAAAAAAVERELARLRVARKFRHRGHAGISRGSIGDASGEGQ